MSKDTFYFKVFFQAPHSVLLIGVLNNITVGVQPDIFFNFSGGHGAVNKTKMMDG